MRTEVVDQIAVVIRRISGFANLGGMIVLAMGAIWGAIVGSAAARILNQKPLEVLRED